ncbi:hypothetical protein ACFL35_06505 [Candidatus Riflebacteria bacterium]
MHKIFILFLFLLFISNLEAIDEYDPMGEDEITLESVLIGGKIKLSLAASNENFKLFINHNLIGFFPNGSSFSRKVRGFGQGPYLVFLKRLDGEILFKNKFPAYWGIDISEKIMLETWLKEKFRRNPTMLQFLFQNLNGDKDSLNSLYSSLIKQVVKSPSLTPENWILPEKIRKCNEKYEVELKKEVTKYPEKIDFKEHLLPIIEKKCMQCHIKSANPCPIIPLDASRFLMYGKKIQDRVCVKKDIPPLDSEVILTPRQRSMVHDYIENNTVETLSPK